MAVAFFAGRFGVAFSESTPCASVRDLHSPPSRQFRHYRGYVYTIGTYLTYGIFLRLETAYEYVKLFSKTKKASRLVCKALSGAHGVDSKKARPKPA